MTSAPATSPSLKRRVLGASVWSVAGYGFNLCIRFGGNLVMTRLLLPEMYGIMAVASTVLTGLVMFSDLGLKPNVIQSHRGDDPDYLNTVWVTQIVRGLVLWLGALLASVIIAQLARWHAFPEHSVYADPSVPYVVAALSVTLIVSGFESTRLLQASRGIALARPTLVEIASQVGGLVAMLAWSLKDRSIWALVAGAIAAASLRTALSFLALPGASNRWHWDRAAFAEIVHVGKWIFLSSVSFFFAGSGDRVMLGGLVDAATMGTYAIAYLFFSSADQILSRIIVDISFPALGEVQRNHPERLKVAYYRFHAVIAGATYLSTGVLAVSGHMLIDTLYDSRYQLAGHTLEILSVALLTLPFRIASQSLLLFGAANLYFWFNLARLVTLFIAIPAGFASFGYDGALWGIVASYFANLPLIVAATARFGLFDLRRELYVLPALLVGVVLGLMVNHAISSFH